MGRPKSFFHGSINVSHILTFEYKEHLCMNGAMLGHRGKKVNFMVKRFLLPVRRIERGVGWNGVERKVIFSFFAITQETANSLARF